MDMHFVRFLAVAIHPPVALLHAVGIPWNLEMDQLRAVVLQIDTLRGGISGKKNAHRRFFGVRLKRSLDRLAVVVGHATVDHFQATFFGKAFAGQQVKQPFLSSAIFGEDDDPLFIPLATGAQGLLQPVDEGLRLAVGALACLSGVLTELPKQLLFLPRDGR
ncbi:MAG: hypothetical protein JW395_4113 [Nitrospira sp.]|nr:hypothetical protein [Nitrospira sp.]